MHKVEISVKRLRKPAMTERQLRAAVDGRNIVNTGSNVPNLCGTAEVMPEDVVRLVCDFNS